MKKNRYSLAAFLVNLVKVLLFWDKASVQILELNTLFPIEGTPITLSWHTKHVLWVRIKGVRRILPPNGEINFVAEAGEQRIILNAFSLINQDSCSLVFHVEGYKRQRVLKLEVDSPKRSIGSDGRINRILRLDALRTNKFALMAKPIKMASPKLLFLQNSYFSKIIGYSKMSFSEHRFKINKTIYSNKKLQH